jgi:hypothetical protein
MAYETLQCIVEYCQEHLSDNALVIKSKEKCKLVVPVNNHLQDSQDKEEDHQEGEVDKELHTTNAMIIYEATLSSNDSYYAPINDNCFEEVLCRDTNFGNVNIDELEIELCHTNMKGHEWHDISSKYEPIITGDELEKEVVLCLPPVEYYEVFP